MALIREALELRNNHKDGNRHKPFGLEVYSFTKVWQVDTADASAAN